MKQLRKIYNQLKGYRAHHPADIDNRIQLYNYGGNPAPQDYWLARFIQEKGLLRESNISIFSVFGWRKMIGINRNATKIFIARENLHRPNWSEYADIALNEESIDLCLGFDYDIDDERYMRFPLWIMWMISPKATYADIVSFCNRINDQNNSSYDDRKFCTFISSHADDGREELMQEINTIGHVDCCGRYLHNCDDLKSIYNDNKLELLKHYRFNLCPENSNYNGYCTEKLFEAIASGCIPIYWGSDQQPEPEIINQNAICFIRLGEKNNADTLNHIRDLNNDKEAYLHFAHQPRMLPGASDIIMQYIDNLESRLQTIINNS